MKTESMSLLSLTINGIAIRVAPGTTVLEAARRNDIYIPTLCFHPQLRSEGSCRLCLVEVEGVRGLSPACTLPVTDGMIVRTETPEIRELRKEILSLTLSEHPYSCLTCDRHSRCGEWQTTIRKAGVTTGCENCPKNGQCELQVLVEKIGLHTMPYPIAYRGLPVEQDDPFFDRDYNLCVLCGRCVRVCQEVRHTNTLGFLLRGSQTRVGAAPDRSHLELDCEFCGACVDVCPTGALFDKRTKWEGAPDSTATTICPYCSVGCQLDLRLKNGGVTGVRPNADGAANRGQACVRGRFGLVELIHAEGRLSTPMLRRDGKLVDSSWEEALATAAERLASFQGDSFALLGSPHLTSESAFVLQRFAREVMRSRNVDCATALPRHTAAHGLREVLLAPSHISLPSIRDAKCILVIGSNPRLSHPVVAMYIRQALRMGGARLIVVDPRETELARRAHVWLRPAPGTDAQMLEALAGRRKSNPDNITEATRLLEENSPAVIIFGSGITHHSQAPESIRAIHHLADSLRTPAHIFPLVGASNTLGVMQAGLTAGEGDRNYEEIASGISAGAIHALYVAGELPPLPSLESLSLLIVQDLVLAPHLREKADIVLPAASFAEADGTLKNLEGRDQTFHAAIPPYRQARPDWQIAAELARKMGAQGFAYGSAAEVWRDIASHPEKIFAVGVKKKSAGAKARSSRRASSSTFTLITERNAFAYRGFSLTRQIQDMAAYKPDEQTLILHSEDAARLGLRAGDPVEMATDHGTDSRTAVVRDSVLPGTVFASINPLEGSPIYPGWLPTEKTILVELRKAAGAAGKREETS